MSIPNPTNWRVEMPMGGRDGYIGYYEEPYAAGFYWEYGGEDVVFIIYIGQPSTWSKQYPWAADRRQEIVERVGQEVIRQSAPGCRAEVDVRDDGYTYLSIRTQERSSEPSAQDLFDRAKAKYLADGSFTITETDA